MTSKSDFFSHKSKEDQLAFKAGVLYLIAELFTRGISFMLTPFFTRLLPPSVYADSKIFESWVYLIAPVISLSLYHSMARGKYDYGKSYSKFLSSTMFLMLILSFGTLVVTFPFGNAVASFLGYSPPLLLLMLGYCLSYNCIQCIQLYDRQLLNYKRNILLTLLGVLPGVVTSLVLVVIFRFKLSDDQLLSLRIVSFFLPTIVVGLIFMIRIFIQERAFVNKEYWSYGLKYSLPLMAGAITSQIFFQSGNIFVRDIVGSESAAIVSIAMTVGYIMDILIHAVDNAWKPWMFEMINKGEIKRVKRFWRYLMLGLALLICLLNVFAPELTLFLGGKQYANAIYLISPILCASLANFLMIGYTSLEQYMKKTKISGIASVIAAVVCLILNYILISTYGYKAAAYTLLICYVLACVIHGILIRKAEQYDILQWGFSSALILVTFIFCTISSFAYEYSFFVRCGICLGLLMLLCIMMRKKINEVVSVILHR